MRYYRLLTALMVISTSSVQAFATNKCLVAISGVHSDTQLMISHSEVDYYPDLASRRYTVYYGVWNKLIELPDGRYLFVDSAFQSKPTGDHSMISPQDRVAVFSGDKQLAVLDWQGSERMGAGFGNRYTGATGLYKFKSKSVSARGDERYELLMSIQHGEGHLVGAKIDDQDQAWILAQDGRYIGGSSQPLGLRLVRVEFKEFPNNSQNYPSIDMDKLSNVAVTLPAGRDAVLAEFDLANKIVVIGTDVKDYSGYWGTDRQLETFDIVGDVATGYRLESRGIKSFDDALRAFRQTLGLFGMPEIKLQRRTLQRWLDAGITDGTSHRALQAPLGI